MDDKCEDLEILKVERFLRSQCVVAKKERVPRMNEEILKLLRDYIGRLLEL